MTDKVKLTSRERAIKCALFALDKKALNVKVLEIGRLSSIADYLVLASGTSDKQTQAIADSVKTGAQEIRQGPGRGRARGGELDRHRLW